MYHYNFFVSHASEDKAFAEKLCEEFTVASAAYWIDEMIEPGAHIPKAIDNALKVSKHLILLLSTNSIESGWVYAEYWSKLMEDPSNEGRKVIPVMLDDCELQGFLSQLKCIDATDGDTQKAALCIME